MGDRKRELTRAYHKCRGCGRLVDGHVGHGPGCMLREDLKKFHERISGKIVLLPGMTNFCPRCHQPRPDKEARHVMCPRRLPE